MTYTLTSLRKNLFKVVDELIKTGIPVEIERKGHRLKIVLEKNKSKLDNLRSMHAMRCDPESYVEMKVAEWTPDDN